MKKIKTILNEHAKWILTCGKDGACANLIGANLRDADLRGANLRDADLRGADLRDANLRGADLRDANLGGADLIGANLIGANLRDANLGGADLIGANLRDANLRGANLRGADLRDANLGDANLRGANLGDADLNDIMCLFYPIHCPEKGSFIGYKKACDYIVELRIEEDALRSSAISRKCRCSKATVLSITNLDGSNADITSVTSSYDSNFIYESV